MITRRRTTIQRENLRVRKQTTSCEILSVTYIMEQWYLYVKAKNGGQGNFVLAFLADVYYTK